MSICITQIFKIIYFLAHNMSIYIVLGILKQTFNTIRTGGQDFPKEDFMT